MVTVKFIYDLLEKDLLIHEEVFLIALVWNLKKLIYILLKTIFCYSHKNQEYLIKSK